MNVASTSSSSSSSTSTSAEVVNGTKDTSIVGNGDSGSSKLDAMVKTEPMNLHGGAAGNLGISFAPGVLRPQAGVPFVPQPRAKKYESLPIGQNTVEEFTHFLRRRTDISHFPEQLKALWEIEKQHQANRGEKCPSQRVVDMISRVLIDEFNKMVCDPEQEVNTRAEFIMAGTVPWENKDDFRDWVFDRAVNIMDADLRPPNRIKSKIPMTPYYTINLWLILNYVSDHQIIMNMNKWQRYEDTYTVKLTANDEKGDANREDEVKTRGKRKQTGDNEFLETTDKKIQRVDSDEAPSFSLPSNYSFAQPARIPKAGGLKLEVFRVEPILGDGVTEDELNVHYSKRYDHLVDCIKKQTANVVSKIPEQDVDEKLLKVQVPLTSLLAETKKHVATKTELAIVYDNLRTMERQLRSREVELRELLQANKDLIKALAE